ncbi:MAG: carbohydrate binding family 9 domain-containing protein [Lewinella sp.]|nr:carbohydrate binding family 9 domain-containing protein [Lewinella sp.]
MLISSWAQDGMDAPGAIGVSTAEDTDHIFLRYTEAPISIDGQLDESAWYAGQPAVNFWENFPSDSTLCDWPTEVYMAFDDDFLYIGAKCYAPGQAYIVPSLRRDYRAGGSDNITFLLDPFRDRTNAFVFGINPYGVMREALISNGGRDNRDWLGEWDNRWQGASIIHDDYWSCELAIPFSTLRFPEGQTEWYFNSYRFDTQSNTRSTWVQIPQNQTIMSLAYMSSMEWEQAPEPQGNNFSVIPYVIGSTQRDFEAGTPVENGFNVGADAKIAVSSGLNLDLTINPDFSQVEVDQQVINLDRFEVFFPERRQFFLENADLFSNFGDGRANPFFSRRIGVTQDTSTGEARQNAIYFGARLSGKLDNNWRLGLLSMQAGKDEANGLPSYNYTVAAVQRKLFARSNVGFIFVNKQTLADISEDTSDNYNPYNRVMGLDYNLASSDNRWIGKFYFHHSFSPEQLGQAFSHGAILDYRVRRFALGLEQRYVGDGFNAEVGFVPRTNYFQLSQRGDLFFYPSHGRINRHGPGFRSRQIWTPGEGRTDGQLWAFWNFDFTNTSELNLRVITEYIYLLEEFDPTGTDAIPLPGEQGYRFTRYSAEYRSDQRRKFSWSVEPTLGQFFNGNRYALASRLTYRYQPLGQISLQANYNYIDLPEPYASTGLFLIGPRIDFTFTKSLFLTTFIQYNSQIDNLNINARFQWRFAPVSDFFLVYTDNYNSLDWNVKGRSLVAKVTYWLNP